MDLNVASLFYHSYDSLSILSHVNASAVVVFNYFDWQIILHVLKCFI